MATVERRRKQRALLYALLLRRRMQRALLYALLYRRIKQRSPLSIYYVYVFEAQKAAHAALRATLKAHKAAQSFVHLFCLCLRGAKSSARYKSSA